MKLWPFSGGETTKARQTVDAAASLVVGTNLTPQWAPDNFENFATEGYSRNEVAFACVQAIATSGSEARLRLMAGPRDEPEEVVSGPLVDLLEQPNDEQSQFEFVEELLTYLYIAGNNYVFKLRGGGGKVLSWHNLRPDRVQVWPGDRGGQRVRGYIYQLDGIEYLIEPGDIVHIKRPNPANDWYGLSPFHVLARRVNLDSSMTAFQKVFFENAGVLSGILKMKRKLQTQEEANRIKGQWRAQLAGIRNWHRIAVLDEDADYQQMAIDLDKMTMMDLTTVSESRICMTFGVPLSVVGAVLGMQSSSYANRESDQQNFWRNTLMPEYRRICGALTRGSRDDFTEARQSRIEPDFAGVAALRENEDAKHKRANEGWTSGLLTRNQALTIIGLDQQPPEWGDVYRTSISVIAYGPGKPEPVLTRATTQPPGPAAAAALDEPAPDQPQKMLTAPHPDEWRTLNGPETEREARYLQLLEQSVSALRSRMEADITAYHARWSSRVNGVMGRQMQLRPGTFEGKALDDLGFDEDDLLPPEADTDLQRLFAALQLLIIEVTWNSVNLSGLLGDIPFEAGAPPVQRLLAEGATRVVQINDTTRQAIRESLVRGVANGYSIQQMANGVPADGYPGIRSIVTEMYRGRAETIARTETAVAQNTAAAERYRAAGVVRVKIMDGTQDDACAAVAGTEQSLEWFASNPTAHPRCIRAGLPIIEAVNHAGVIG